MKHTLLLIAMLLGGAAFAQNPLLPGGQISLGTFSGTSSGTNTGDNATNTLYSGLVSNATHTGDATGATALTVVAINGVNMATLATGILRNTTTTGVPSIAVAGDFPTLNQSTTGSAATLTTPRAIYGNNFNGSAALTGIIASTYGGTGNGFAKISGPATSEKTLTFPNASATVLTDNAVVTVAQGGTNATSPGITAFNNITGYTAAGATGTTSTNLVFSTAPTFVDPITNSLTISGNQSAAAWTTNGIRIKGVAGTLTDITSSGTVAAAYTNVLGGNTIAATNTTTFTNYFTNFYKDPIAGTNVTLTNKWALGTESLRVGTSNQLTVSNTGVLTAIAPILGTPTSVTLTNATGLPLTSGVTGVLPIANGGLNLSTIGAASQQLRVNAGATALEYFTPSAGSGDIVNGGNTTAATVTIGTNDANALNLETNNVARVAITGGASTGGAMTLTNVTANTNAVQDVLTIQSNSSGTAAASFGPGLLFQGESSTTDNRDMVRLSSIWTTPADASRASALVYSDVTAAGALTERFRFGPTAMTTAAAYIIGNSSNVLTLSSSNAAVGSVSISTNGNSCGARFSNTSSNATNPLISIGAGNNRTNSSGTINFVSLEDGFAPTSGTAIFNQMAFIGTINQTGGANGITRGVYINNTITAAVDYRSFQTDVNTANAKGFVQTGALTTNNFVGRTTFGATTTPTALVLLAAGTATVPPLQQTSGTLNTTALAGGIEFNGGHYRTKTGGLRFADGGVIADHYADVSNVTTTETVIYSYTTPANTLSSDGEKISFSYTLNLTDITSTALIKMVYGGTAIANTGALTVSATGAVVVSGWIVRTSATTARTSVSVSSPTASTAVYTYQTDMTGLTLSGTNVLSVNAQAGGASGGSGDIVGKMGTVSWSGVAAN